MFNNYRADIPKTKETEIALYANDLALLTKYKNVKIAVQKAADKIALWQRKWRIKMNANKTQAINITRRRKQPTANLTVEGTKIP